MTRKEVFIPFCGFYESWVDDIIDNCVEYELEYHELDFDQMNYEVDFEAIARNYVKLYSDELFEQLDEEGAARFMPDLYFERLISPREYNFETDRILCSFTVPRYNLRRIYDTLVGNAASLNRDIQKEFASRSGFASFYDDFAKGWKEKPLRDWDANELSVLMPDVVEPYIDEPWFREAIDQSINFKVPANDAA